MPNEEVYFERNQTVVTKTLVRVGGTSYPINGIGSVVVRKPAAAGYYVIGLIIALFGLVSFSADAKTGATGIGIGLLVVAAGMTLKSALILRTASGDQRAVESRNVQLLLEVKAAIERAVAARG